MKISIEHYIVTNNPASVNAMFVKRGIAPAKNLADGIQKLRYILAKEGQAALDEVGGIDTPYQKLIISTHHVPQPESKSNACGCSGADGEKTSNCSGTDCKCGKSNFVNNDNLVFNADGTGTTAPVTTPAPASPITPQKVEDTINKHAPLLVVGLLIILTTAVLIKK